MIRFICMREHDTVATALQDAHVGDIATIYDSANKMMHQVDVHENIPFGNKIALANMKNTENVIKYGEIIGQCTTSIKMGHLVHVHNVKSLIADVPAAIKKTIIKEMNLEVTK